MRYIVLSLILLISLAGIIMLCGAGGQLVLEFVRSPYLLRAEGRIVEFKVHEQYEGSPTDGRSHQFYIGYPIVSFQTANGETIVFTSRVGMQVASRDALDKRLKTKIGVLYDPKNILSPMIDLPSVNLNLWFFSVLGLVLIVIGALFLQLFGRSKNLSWNYSEVAHSS